MCEEGKIALLLGKGMEGVSYSVMEEVGECIVLGREVVAEKEGFVVWKANGRILVSSPPPSLNSWTQLTHYFIIVS